ncbi:DUF445 family protein [Chitinophagales bacterium]|nr:DUF445 family protein [Chitinophagales bacterium]
MEISKLLVLLSLPIVGAVIGWFTNFLAVKMLFHPREPKKFLFFTFQGVFPKRQREIASRLAKVVAKELFSSDELKERLAEPKNIALITSSLEEKLNDYLVVRFPDKYPWVDLFFGDYIRGDMKGELMTEVNEMAPVMIKRYINQLDESIDVEQIVYDKVSNFSVKKLENMMQEILDKELGFIEKVGAVVGFIVGLVQMALVTLI